MSSNYEVKMGFQGTVWSEVIEAESYKLDGNMLHFMSPNEAGTYVRVYSIREDVLISVRDLRHGTGAPKKIFDAST